MATPPIQREAAGLLARYEARDADRLERRMAGRPNAPIQRKAPGLAARRELRDANRLERRDESRQERLIDSRVERRTAGRTGGGAQDSTLPLSTPESTAQYAQNIYDEGVKRLQPQHDALQRGFYGNMADRGMPVNGEAWNLGQTEITRGISDALASLALGAQAAGGAEESRRVGLNLNINRDGRDAESNERAWNQDARANYNMTMQDILRIIQGGYMPTDTAPKPGGTTNVDTAGVRSGVAGAQDQSGNDGLNGLMSLLTAGATLL